LQALLFHNLAVVFLSLFLNFMAPFRDAFLEP
jgi:hypothetical protein